MADQQDPLEYSSERFRKIKEEALDAIRGTADLDEGWQEAQKAAEEYYKQMKQQKALAKQLGKEYEEVFKKAQKQTEEFVKPYEKFINLTQRFPIDKIFNQDKIEGAFSEFKTEVQSNFEQMGGGVGDNISQGLVEGFAANKQAIGGLFKSVLGALNWGRLIGGGLLLAGGSIFNAMWQRVKQVEEATSSLISETGVLDDTLSTTLIEATEQSGILGGNLEYAAKTVEEIYKQFSAGIPITADAVSKIATISEKFQLGEENATKLVRVIQERMGTGLSRSADLADNLIDSFGRLGPAVTRNLVENYEEVNNKFGLGINQLAEQAFYATKMGNTLSELVSTAESLLDIGSSMKAQFKASALIGEQINLNQARRLGYSGDLQGMNEAILDQVESIANWEELGYFRRQALAQATGKTVSELQNELNIRRRIGRISNIERRSRERAISKFDTLSRKIERQFFKIFSSPEVQDAVENLALGVERLLESGFIQGTVDTLSDLVDWLGRMMGGSAGIEFNAWNALNPWGNVVTVDGWDQTSPNVAASALSGGASVSTNPNNYVQSRNGNMNTQNGGAVDKETVDEIKGFLKHLKENGVQAGDTYLDSKKINRGLAKALR